jgi:hypothetical protein
MALTAIQKKIMRKALCFGWFKSNDYKFKEIPYMVTPQDLVNLGDMSDAEVVAVIDEYRAWKIETLTATIAAQNIAISHMQDDIAELN